MTRRPLWMVLLGGAVTLFVATVLAFAILALLPGDPTTAILGEGATAEARAEVRADLRLDDPIPVRFLAWFADVVQGDLGTSYVNDQPVGRAVGERVLISFELVVLAQLLALTVTFVLAMIAAPRRDRLVGRAIVGVANALAAVPSYAVAALLAAVFAGSLGWFPVAGWTRVSEGFGAHLVGLVLPAVALAIGAIALYLPILISEMHQMARQDFVAAARARGVGPVRLVRRHVLRPSLGVLVAAVGLNAGALIGGTVIVEEIFAIPGLGRLLVSSVGSRDYAMIQGVVVVVAAFSIGFNLLADLAARLVDPRFSG